jgi:hypothetical protein
MKDATHAANKERTLRCLVYSLQQRAAGRKRPHNPNNTRIRELSQLARCWFPDGSGDYVLPETEIGQHFALAIITHLARAGQCNRKWLTDFCCSRAPWLDPGEIDVAKLRPLKAPALGWRGSEGRRGC